MIGSARYYQLTGDRPYLNGVTRAIARLHDGDRAADSATARAARPERYSSDIRTRVYGLHSQAIVWEGLSAMARSGRRPGTGPRCRTRAAAREPARTGLRRAVRRPRIG